jgi:hypothetical protein
MASTSTPETLAAEIWPRVDGYRITKVLLAVQGEADLMDDPKLAEAIRMGKSFRAVVEGQITGRAYRFNPTKGSEARTAKGVVTLVVTDIHEIVAMEEPAGRVLAPAPRPEPLGCPEAGCAFLVGHEGDHGQAPAPAEEGQNIDATESPPAGILAAVMATRNAKGEIVEVSVIPGLAVLRSLR